MDRHVPLRTCIGCRTRRGAADVVRITRDHRDGHDVIVVDGPSSGRGAWLCRGAETTARAECLETAIRRGGFARAWRTSLDADDNEEIRAALAQSPAG